MSDFVIFQSIKLLPVSIDDAKKIVIRHIDNKAGDYFCLANIHLIMEAHKNTMLKIVLNESAGNFPDGMGVAGALKFAGHKFKGRVRGTDLMLKLCEYASEHKLKIYLYGNTEQTLNSLKNKLMKAFPGINIVSYFSPPFRELTPEEDDEITEKINEADPDIIFVSLGAPKQEKWMFRHREKIRAVKLGVGAAFDFITGNLKQAPIWMQNAYLEWLYRFPQQPSKTLYRMSLAPEFFFRTIQEVLMR